MLLGKQILQQVTARGELRILEVDGINLYIKKIARLRPYLKNEKGCDWIDRNVEFRVHREKKKLAVPVNSTC